MGLDGREQPVALAVFAKAPRPGRVKTRLAGALGAAMAARFHRRCVQATWRRLAGLSGCEPFLYCDRPWAEFEALAGPAAFRLQRGECLGDRMRACLRELLADGFRKALILGSDAPALPLRQVREARIALEEAEVVLGPSADGGFTLIGATRTSPSMFRGVPWSSPATRLACLRALREAGLSSAETPTEGYDIDTPRDLARLLADPRLPGRLRRWLLGRLPRRSEEFLAPLGPESGDHGTDLLGGAPPADQQGVGRLHDH